MSKNWSAFDSTKGARTIAEIDKKPKARGVYSRHPLFKFIPIDHVVIDTLHWIADLLINLPIQDLRRVDGIAKATNVDLSKHQHYSV